MCLAAGVLVNSRCCHVDNQEEVIGTRGETTTDVLTNGHGIKLFYKY